MNSWDLCGADRVISYTQNITAQHLDDLQSSHVDSKVTDHFLNWLEKLYKDSNIMSPILLQALSRAKICRYMSRAVLYSLPMHHGMGRNITPYYTQIMKNLIELLHERSSMNPSSQFFQVARVAMGICTGLQWTQLYDNSNK